MANFNSPVKVFIKSKNNINKIYNNYNISLIIFSILTIISNLLLKRNAIVFSFIKTLIITLFISIMLTYIINIFKKEYSLKKVYTEDTIISIAIIISLFSLDVNIYIQILAILVTIIIKNIFKKINISSVLYGILIILLYKYYTNTLNPQIIITSKDTITSIIKYLLDIKYLCPVISIISFIYLFYHKSIKYTLVFSYLLTFIIIMFMYGIFNNFNMYFQISEIINSAIIFLTIYTLADYKITPTISEGNAFYGIILGIISAILRFIIPNFAIVITFILGPLLTKGIDKISPKIKYNNKLYVGLMIISIAMMILTAFLLNIYF